MSNDSININIGGIKEGFNKSKKFLGQKKVWNIILIVLFLTILITGSWIRTQNLPLLKDSTTGEYIPVALDPFYFLRIAETIVDQGGLPEYDEFRKPFDIPFTKEILPRAVVLIFNVWKIFDSDVTIQFADIISPVVFFILGLIAFFFLVYFLTKSKLAALISSAFLAVIPSYLYRTAAGFSDHESIGMFAFFLALLTYTLAMKFLDKEHPRKNILLKSALFGVLVGLATSFTIASWGGIANLLFMIIPLSFGIFWLIKSQNISYEIDVKKKFLNYLAFYLSWFVSTILSNLLYGNGLRETLGRVTLGSTNILTGALLLFIITDFAFIIKKDLLKRNLRKYRILVSLVGSMILGALIFVLMGNNLFSILSDVINRLLHPFGTDRVSLTVAENRQPFLNDWINQIGKILFWLFFGGLITLGLNMAGTMKKHKDKILFSLLWTFLIFGILFSRISATSLFNGTNLISRLFYFGSAALFLIYLTKLYFRERINIRSEYIIMFSWAIFMLIAAKGAIRTFFLITPFTCFSLGLLVTNLSRYVKKSRDDLLKLILGILLIVVIVLSVISFNNSISSVIVQAKNTGPSAHVQWQQAMKWVRENTPENSIFVHWWDYGYWVQYLGERPTLSDGGHFEGAFRDHVVGRYLLTTPRPETALSFMKTNDVSYLLIDPTDIGKYGAYSTIGSDSSGNDRTSFLPTMILNPDQTQRTNDSELRLYLGSAPVDEDIVYNLDGNEIFLPSGQAAIVGTFLEITNGGSEIKQPNGLFIYNNQQIQIPLRYLYVNGELIDFGSGLDSGVYVVPTIEQSQNQGLQINNLGSMIYLSPKVFKSLVAQLYLMDDPLNQYPTISIAHSETDLFVNSLRSQGALVGDFVFFNGLRGPIKIWKVDYPDNILEKEEFLRMTGDYAEFDDLQFTI